MDFADSRRCVCFLVDNGSLQPAATLRLRSLAAALSARIGRPVDAVSLLHSSAVPAAELDGEPAEILEPALRRRAAAGIERFVVVPLFFGPSRALTGYLPRRLRALAREFPRLEVAIAPPVVDPGEPDDVRVARILVDHVADVMRGLGDGARPIAVVVDHGSPERAVMAVRDRVVEQLRTMLGARVRTVIAASMERREGPEYAFTEPLLERALAEGPCGAGAGDVVVAPMFFSAGRHAGPGGDIETICRAAEERHPGLRVHLAKLVGEHPALVEILADRYRAVTEAEARDRQ